MKVRYFDCERCGATGVVGVSRCCEAPEEPVRPIWCLRCGREVGRVAGGYAFCWGCVRDDLARLAGGTPPSDAT